MMRKVEIPSIVHKDEDKSCTANDIQQTDQDDPPESELPFPGCHSWETKDKSGVQHH